ncbi:hypothetical protein FA10DRAFT_268510, partial [Acaromyces ingoldii]
MPGNHPRLERSTLTFNILCLVLAILDWPVNILNFIIPLLDDVYYFDPGYNYRYSGSDGSKDLAVSVLGLIFVIVAISQAAFQFCPVVIHSMDLDRKIRPRLRLRWLLAYAIIETVYLILTAAFGFSYAGTRYTFERGDHYNVGDTVPFIPLSVSVFLQICSVTVIILFYRHEKRRQARAGANTVEMEATATSYSLDQHSKPYAQV